jgi:hypothetical protein
MRYSLIYFLLMIQSFTWAQSYEKIHFKYILVDTHNDFLSKAVEEHVAFDTDLKGITQSDLSRMQAGGVKVQIFPFSAMNIMVRVLLLLMPTGNWIHSTQLRPEIPK